MINDKYCQCGHEESDHKEFKCAGACYDQGINIGEYCYCPNFKKRDQEWEERCFRMDQARLSQTLWQRIKSYLGYF